MNDELLLAQRRLERATVSPEPGVQYKLRVIENSGGMLELVEERPKLHWFLEWASVMQRSGWGF